MEPTTPSIATASPSGLSLLNSGNLSLLFATPTPTQVKTPRLRKKKAPTERIDVELTPTIPQKRQRVVEEREEFEFRANSSFSSIFKPSLTKSMISTPINSALDIKMIIQNAISPLITEIKGLKEEIQQLKANGTKTASSKALGPNKETPKSAQELISTPILAKKTLSTTISKNIANQTPQPPAKKPTYADVLREEPRQARETSSVPWTLVKKKKPTPLVQELAPKKATEPCQRRIIFQRQKDAPKNVNLPNLLLALNKAMKQ